MTKSLPTAGSRPGRLRTIAAALVATLGLLYIPDTLAADDATAPASGTATPAAQAPSAAEAHREPPRPAAQANQQAKTFPMLDVKPTSVDFASQPVGSASVTKTVTVSALKDTEAVTLDIHVSGSFTVSPTKCELATGGSCALSVTFSPTQLGPTDSAIVATDSISHTSRVLAPLAGTGSARCDRDAFLACRGGATSVAPVALMVLLYLVGLLAVRWNMIAIPTRRLLLAEIGAVQARVDALVAVRGGLMPAGLAQVSGLLSRASDEVPVTGSWPLQMDVLFWSRGHESAGWGLVHEAEEQLAVFLDQEQVRASLERSEALLRHMTSADAAPLARQIQAELARTVVAAGDRPGAVLAEIVDFLCVPTSDIRTAVTDILTQAPPPAADACAALASRLSATLSPQASSLVTQVSSALADVPPTIPAGVQILLEEARDAILPKAASLATSLDSAVAANPAVLPPDWLKLLTVASDYLAAANTYAARVQAMLGASPTYPLARWRALLSEALGVVYERRDTNFATLVSWHNKTSWLTGCGLLLILALSAALGNEVLFLLGATGGLLSRLSRSLYRQDVPTDYGASWTTLFLSPVVGALGGWAGVLLVALAEKLGVLGPVFESIRWDSPYGAMAYGLAFVFGFSERAFNTVLSQLEDKVINQSNQTTSSKPVITTATTLTPGQVGQAYTASIAASGGKPPLIWTVTNGPLPGGLSLDQTGKIAGKPTTAVKEATFTLQVRDSAGATDSRTFGVTIT